MQRRAVFKNNFDIYNGFIPLKLFVKCYAVNTPIFKVSYIP